MFKSQLLAAAIIFAGGTAHAQDSSALSSPPSVEGEYEISMTNLTPGQTFTPQLMVTHQPYIALFEIGAPASPELEALAEGGDTGPLTTLVMAAGSYAMTTDGPLGPGQTGYGMIGAVGGDVLSIAAMLLPTNDTFVSLNGMPLPPSGSVTYYLKAYDAGTEENDQRCIHIPGPICGGEAVSEPADGDEGFVHVSNGFHNLRGNALKPEKYDWRNPVAKVTITRR